VAFYISVGVNAANNYYVRGPARPTLFTLLPSTSLPSVATQRALACQPECIFSILDQPLKRKLQLLQYALPDHKKIALFYSRYSEQKAKEIISRSYSHELKVNITPYNKSNSLLENLSPILSKTDLLLAIPDPEVYNRQTARSIILMTYRKEVPIFGYSESFTRAGALLSLHSSPEEFARHNADVAMKILNGRKVQYGVIYPKYFSVSVNQTVARSLDIKLDSSIALTNWLRKKDGDSR
jgi:ABC-type uncharacterized transport system substrate-binding protein